MKVLVTRTDRLGDLVLSLPVLALLKQSHPDWEIHVMVAPAAVALVENDPHVTQVWTWQDSLMPDECRQLGNDLRAAGFAAVVMLQYRRELATLLRRAGIPRRYGPWSKWSSWLQLNRGSRQNRSAGRRHEMEFNLQLARRLLSDHSADCRSPVPVPQLYLDVAQQQETRDFRTEFLVRTEQLVFVHPGSGGSALDWEPSRFAAVANELAGDANRRVFVTGSAADTETVNALALRLEPAVTVLLGRYPLRNFLAVLAAGDLFIGPSTGPLHIAAALGVPTIGLFPPLRTMHPDRWGPRGVATDRGHNLVPERDCPARRHCHREKCPHYNCMNDVRVAEVLAVARKLLVEARA